VTFTISHVIIVAKIVVYEELYLLDVLTFNYGFLLSLFHLCGEK